MADLIAMLGAAAGAAAGGGEVDPNFNQTVLLLHGDGTNGAQNNTFVDSSTNNFTITRNGNTTQGTFSPFSAPDGGWSNSFDGSGDYLSIANSSAFDLSGDFTIETLIYFNAISATEQTIAGKWSSSSFGWIMQVTSTAVGMAYGNNGSFIGGISAATTLTAGQWYHIAISRSGSSVRTFLNGTQIGTTATVTSNLTSTNSLEIARNIDSGGVQYVNGYMSNLRIVKGTALYTSNFTAPTAPLTAVSNTQLLTCQSSRFIDNSTNNFSITRAGDTKVTPFSPFAPTAAYSPTTNGGSGYFDGTGDYLTVADNTALDVEASDFTIEFFYYPLATPVAGGGLVSKRATSATFGGVLVYFAGTSLVPSLLVTVTGSSWGINTASSQSFTLNQWNHCAVTRSGSTWKLFVNAVAGVTATLAGTVPNNTAALGIGVNAADGDNPMKSGYISNFRLLKGTAIDFASTGVPTAPLTAITNTSLLLNFTNAGIFDQTGKNVLETVGNAQIDTTTKKYGTGSMEFDGTGDWLKVPNSPDIQLGTGDFTIEFWVYLASGDTGSNRGLVGKGGASTGWLVSLNTTEKVVFTYTTSTITSSGAITTNAWNHIAVVREGTGSNETKIYIGGTNDGTGTVSTDFNQTEVMYIGANRAAGDPMKGFIDDLRITKGVARYTANFTPPTKAYPDL